MHIENSPQELLMPSLIQAIKINDVKVLERCLGKTVNVKYKFHVLPKTI